MAERWAIIPGFANYEASSLGRVKSLDHESIRRIEGKKSHVLRVKGRILKSENKKNGAGYLHVGLSNEGVVHLVSVHRAVAAAFIGPSDGREVNHKNLNKTDNRLENLEYVSSKENKIHAVLNGVKYGLPRYGEENSNFKLTNALKLEIRNKFFSSEGLTRAFLAKEYCVSKSTIQRILLNERRVR